MKNFMYIILLALFIYSCGSTHNREMNQGSEEDVVRIGNDSLDFELIVFDPGFDNWLRRQLPMESFNLDYLKDKNRLYTNTYNHRVLFPSRYGNLYPQAINYDPEQEYGMKLNYMLYMYFQYFMEKFDQRL